MQLICQPDDGGAPLLTAVKKARKSIDIGIFRFDLKELQKAIEAAVTRGVRVHALISHTSRGGEKRLRDLESALLAAGVTVSRTADDLVRYHAKFLIVDGRVLYVLGFNFTHMDTTRCRSLGLAVKNQRVVQEATKLFEADANRQAYIPGSDSFVVSPESSRSRLAAFIKGAKHQLLIYDPKINDPSMLRLLHERAAAGVDVRILGKIAKKGTGLQAEKLPKLRLHVRAMLRDHRDLFVGSQSLRALELDRRREVGVIVRHRSVAKKFRDVFEADWAQTKTAEQVRATEAKNAKRDSGRTAQTDEPVRKSA